VNTAIDRVETDRLLCERLRPEHGAELTVLLQDPRVGATLWSRPQVPTDDEVITATASKAEHWEKHGFGMWLLRDRATGKMVGRGGLQHTLVTGEIEVEVGWAIIPERWGEGLATELAFASIGAAFDVVGLPEIIAFTLPHNLASRRVMEKSGFSFDRDVVHVGLSHVLYRLRGRDGDGDGGRGQPWRDIVPPGAVPRQVGAAEEPLRCTIHPSLARGHVGAGLSLPQAAPRQEDLGVCAIPRHIGPRAAQTPPDPLLRFSRRPL
jgi:ribosomal-protein-alanine N-acetyltransferase